VQALLESPHLTALAALNLDSTELGSAGAHALAESPQLARLTALSLCWNDIRDAGARALVKSPFLAGLEYLNLQCAESPFSPAVKDLLQQRWPFVEL
jgi:hypothetical protein